MVKRIAAADRKKVRVKVGDDIDVNSLLYGVECKRFEEGWKHSGKDSAYFPISSRTIILVDKRTNDVKMRVGAPTTAYSSVNVTRTVKDITYSRRSRSLVISYANEIRETNGEVRERGRRH